MLDGNHPLAGYAVRLDIEVVSVRKASAEELEQAQGPRVPSFLRVLAPHELHAPGERPQ